MCRSDELEVELRGRTKRDVKETKRKRRNWKMDAKETKNRYPNEVV